MGAVYLGERQEDFVHRAAVMLLLEDVANDEVARRFRGSDANRMSAGATRTGSN